MLTEEEKELTRFHNKTCSIKIHWTPEWPDQWVVQTSENPEDSIEYYYDVIDTAIDHALKLAKGKG